VLESSFNGFGSALGHSAHLQWDGCGEQWSANGSNCSGKLPCSSRKKARADGLACSQPIDYKALLLVFVGARRELFVGAMSDLKGRLITICMLVGALAMIGLVLTGTLQMRVFRSPVAQIAIK
jgi:hypothetical protein